MVAPKLKFLQLLHFIELFRQSCQLTLHMLSCGPLLWTWREHVGTWWCINRWLWNGYFKWAVVVTQLVERSLPTPEVRGSNPIIGKLLCGTFVYSQLYWKDGNKQKEAGNSALLYNFFVRKKVVLMQTGKSCFGTRRRQRRQIVTNFKIILLMATKNSFFEKIRKCIFKTSF